MAAAKKKINAFIKLQLPAGKARPVASGWPRVGSTRRQHHGVLQGLQRSQRQARRDDHSRGDHGVRPDRTYTFIMKSPPASVLLKKALGLPASKKPGSGSAEPNKKKIGKLAPGIKFAPSRGEDAGHEHQRYRCCLAIDRRHSEEHGHRGRLKTSTKTTGRPARLGRRPAIGEK